MKSRKSYKYRLKTNPTTAQQFVRFAGTCRFVWNKMLAINESRYLAGVPRLSYHDAARLLTLWKQSEDYGWLKTVHSQVLQQCLQDLDRAYINLFAGRAQPPTYRKKFLSDAFRYPQGFRLEGNRVYLPKIGLVRFWKSRAIDGTIKNVTISRTGKHWFVAFQVEMDLPAPMHPATAAVGIDLGLATFAAFSDGALHPPLHAYRRVAKKKARMQRRLAGMVKYSCNWKKQQRRIAHLDLRSANCRHDFLHQLSTDTSKNHAVICVEDLQVKNMLRSARGTFRRMLEYKQAWRGGTVIAVPSRYTSQTCPQCGHVSKENRPQQALFSCVACGYTYHADVVAAQNILARGQRARQNAFVLR
jgi:putative transposase